MGKIILVVAVALIAAVAGLPFWFGMQAESAYAAMIASATQNGDLSVTQSKFERGWFDMVQTDVTTHQIDAGVGHRCGRDGRIVV